jgi:hypothetical protein
MPTHSAFLTAGTDLSIRLRPSLPSLDTSTVKSNAFSSLLDIIHSHFYETFSLAAKINLVPLSLNDSKRSDLHHLLSMKTYYCNNGRRRKNARCELG